MSTSHCNDLEQGSVFTPKFDDNGLMAAVAVDRDSREVLMLAFMNEAALEKTRQTGYATFWSRSRQSLWTKGETSGNLLEVVEMRVDCDQDAIVLVVAPRGPACHTGSRSCFYRRLTDGRLERVET